MRHSDTLAALVAEDATRTIALERFGLDYCCGGNERFDEACARAGLDPASVEAEFEAARSVDNHRCADLAPAELIKHLLDVHHVYLHAELPALVALAGKVVAAHGARHPELLDVQRLITLLADDLVPHMLKEERVLFPAIMRLGDGPSEFPFGSINNPIRMMSLEHEHAGELLERLREATNEYAPPPDGCASYRALYERLAHLDHDTRVHVFEENHFLFPQAAALEEAATE